MNIEAGLPPQNAAWVNEMLTTQDNPSLEWKVPMDRFELNASLSRPEEAYSATSPLNPVTGEIYNGPITDVLGSNNKNENSQAESEPQFQIETPTPEPTLVPDVRVHSIRLPEDDLYSENITIPEGYRLVNVAAVCQTIMQRHIGNLKKAGLDNEAASFDKHTERNFKDACNNLFRQGGNIVNLEGSNPIGIKRITYVKRQIGANEQGAPVFAVDIGENQEFAIDPKLILPAVEIHLTKGERLLPDTDLRDYTVPYLIGITGITSFIAGLGLIMHKKC